MQEQKNLTIQGSNMNTLFKEMTVITPKKNNNFEKENDKRIFFLKSVIGRSYLEAKNN